jgi:uncharacterized protein YheU (UPF0270 family)
MKKGNLRTIKKYGTDQTRYAIEVRTFGGTWRQLNQGKVVLVFDTEPEAIKKLMSFFDPRPLTLRAENEDG